MPRYTYTSTLVIIIGLILGPFFGPLSEVRAQEADTRQEGTPADGENTASDGVSEESPENGQSGSVALLELLNPETLVSTTEVERLLHDANIALSQHQTSLLAAATNSADGKRVMAYLSDPSSAGLGDIARSLLVVFGSIPSGLIGGGNNSFIPNALKSNPCSFEQVPEINLDFGQLPSPSETVFVGDYEILGEIAIRCESGTRYSIATEQILPTRIGNLADGLTGGASSTFRVWVGDQARKQAEVTLLHSGTPLANQEFVASGGVDRITFLARLHKLSDMNAPVSNQGAVDGMAGLDRVYIVVH
ncbi:MAG: hypothetical protein ACPG1C_04885 [Alphaproteobacteria bacterium]